jgi:hypothetical protein
VRRVYWLASAALLCGVAFTSVINLRGQTTVAPEEQFAAIGRQIDGAITALNLYSISDPPNRSAQFRQIVSLWPIDGDWPSRFNLSRLDAARWQGTVAIYVGHPELLHSNFDHDHPERCAVWAGSFVYGDPELIAQLRDCAP